jgi:hypothetical protein
MTIVQVIETRSTDSMPFFTSFFGFLNSLCWTYYGTKIAKDKMISIPNQIGLGVTGLQMLVYIAFGCGKGYAKWNAEVAQGNSLVKYSGIVVATLATVVLLLVIFGTVEYE